MLKVSLSAYYVGQVKIAAGSRREGNGVGHCPIDAHIHGSCGGKSDREILGSDIVIKAIRFGKTAT